MELEQACLPTAMPIWAPEGTAQAVASDDGASDFIGDVARTRLLFLGGSLPRSLGAGESILHLLFDEQVDGTLQNGGQVPVAHLMAQKSRGRLDLVLELTIDGELHFEAITGKWGEHRPRWRGLPRRAGSGSRGLGWQR